MSNGDQHRSALHTLADALAGYLDALARPADPSLFSATAPAAPPVLPLTPGGAVIAARS